MKHRAFLCIVALAMAAGGCAFVPQSNVRLEEARGLYGAAQADTELVRLAPNEMARAADTFHLADSAWSTLDDAAVVDHLAYVAKQRVAIARATARRVTAERASSAARTERDASLDALRPASFIRP